MLAEGWYCMLYQKRLEISFTNRERSTEYSQYVKPGKKRVVVFVILDSLSSRWDGQISVCYTGGQDGRPPARKRMAALLFRRLLAFSRVTASRQQNLHRSPPSRTNFIHEVLYADVVFIVLSRLAPGHFDPTSYMYIYIYSRRIVPFLLRIRFRNV